MEIEIDNEAKWDRWFDKLPQGHQDAIEMAIDLLEALGHNLQMPQAKSLGSGLHELRISVDKVKYRIMYAMSGDTATILTYIKKTSQQAHDKAIKEARKKL